MAISSQTHDVQERQTATVTFTLRDQAAAAVPSAQLTTALITLYDQRTQTVINSRNAQNVLNLNNVAMHDTSGVVTWTVQIADQAIQNAQLEVEKHIALFSFTWSAGAKAWAHEVILSVANIGLFP